MCVHDELFEPASSVNPLQVYEHFFFFFFYGNENIIREEIQVMFF